MRERWWGNKKQDALSIHTRTCLSPPTCSLVHRMKVSRQMLAKTMAEGAAAGRGRVTYNSPTPRRAKAPRLGDVFLTLSRRFVTPSPVVQAKIGHVDQLLLAFWVEVDDACDEDIEALRAVRIGWVSGSAGELHMYKQRLVQPRGTIQARASALHGVTEDIAREEGAPIETVLNDFLADVIEVGMKGGRLISHDVSFHGGVVARELTRCTMMALQKHWKAMMRFAICLKDHDIGRWLLESHNHECTQKPSANALSLKQALRLLLPEHIATPLQGRTALESAAVCLKMARALHDLTIPPCRRPGGHHKWKRVFSGAMRDNGEYTETCSVCGHSL